MKRISTLLLLGFLVIAFGITAPSQSLRLPGPSDILRIANVNECQVSPNGQWLVYSVSTVDGDKTVSRLWLAHLRDLSNPTSRDSQRAIANSPLLPEGWNAQSPKWSPDGESIAFIGEHEGVNALWVVSLRRREPRLLANVQSTNFFITYAGESISWAPDSKRIAYVSAVEEGMPGESHKTEDPRVVDRIRYKSRTSFSDSRRTHIFVVTVERPETRQLTSGPFYDHAISFSPRGDEVVFLSNHESDPDATNNSDIFAVDLSGQVRQLTQTAGCEYQPSWSPDGKLIAYTATKRDVTTIDSVAEDTHVWVISAEGGAGREVTARLDRRVRDPQWSGNGRRIYFLAGDAGWTRIWSVQPDGSDLKQTIVRPEHFIDEDSDEAAFHSHPFQISNFSLATQADVLAFTSSNSLHPAEVWMATGSTGTLAFRVTHHNDQFISSLALVEPEEFRFKSFDGTSIQAWLMKPVGWRSENRYPLILSIHGGPHGMYGWAFNLPFQVFAARGYAVLFLNPRGSSGYGQKFSDGTLNEWGGGDYKDLMLGVDDALRRYPWIDRERMGVTGGSYGGFMTNWIITQTPRFKAAVAVASVSNLISFYSTSLYQDLVHAEFGGFPWDNYDLLWQWSPLRYISQAQTPTLFIHGEQDNDVHITQAEEMYMGLKRRGVETVMVRYPREGHGLREPQHRVDALERTVAWFDHFLK